VLDAPFVPGGDFTRDKRPAQPFVPVGATNRDQKSTFCPGWCLQPGQKAHIPPLAQLVVRPGTKATFCPGPKSSRDKWPGRKACSVVVFVGLQQANLLQTTWMKHIQHVCQVAIRRRIYPSMVGCAKGLLPQDAAQMCLLMLVRSSFRASV